MSKDVLVIVTISLVLEDFSISFKQTEIVERQAYHWLLLVKFWEKFNKMPVNNILE